MMREWYNKCMKKTRALLADDHAVVRAGLHNALTELPRLEIVGEVGDGPGLVAALERLQPDLLLIDVTMPAFDPIAEIRRIRERYPELKILVISAYDDDVYVQGLLGVGVNGYHLKDQPLSDLRLAVQRVLDGERWISSPLLDKLVAFSMGSPEPSVELTPRQRDILQLLQEGLDNKSIAARLDLSVKTVENHLTRLFRQLGVQSRLEAVTYAQEHPEVLGLSGQAAVTHLPPPQEIPLRSPVAILVVDDNARYRRQLVRMIGSVHAQARIYEAGDIEETLHLAASVSPAVIFMDVVLGDGEDGIRCTRRIKAQLPTAHVVLISAYPDRQFHRLGLEAGAVAFLDKKDLDAAVLRQIIEDTV